MHCSLDVLNRQLVVVLRFLLFSLTMADRRVSSLKKSENITMVCDDAFM